MHSALLRSKPVVRNVMRRVNASYFSRNASNVVEGHVNPFEKSRSRVHGELPDEVDVAIIGAGTASLTCAANLAKSGVKVAVFEGTTWYLSFLYTLLWQISKPF